MEINRSGMIAIIGRPNVGKSTLVNQLVGEHVTIVSRKPQTTRNRILAILEKDDCQYIFVDTPGYHKAKSRLDDYMSGIVESSVTAVDAILLVVEPAARIGKPEESLLKQLKDSEVPVILLINKIDLIKKETLFAVMALYAEAYPFEAIIPISAAKGDGMEDLLKELYQRMPEGPRMFPEDMITDQPERVLAAEIIREKILRLLDNEVPHGVAVEIEKMEDQENGTLEVDAVIYCEKASHKGIIIGKNGAMLKRIGQYAREDMEDFFQTKVFLQTWVRVKENWRDRPSLLHSFGYDVE